MNSILRVRSLHASVLPFRRTAHRLTARRSYTLSSYGGENQNISGKHDEENSRETKEREHPGPPPPNVSEQASPSSSPSPSEPRSSAPASANAAPQPASSEPGPSQGHPTTQTPSNQAHPTLTDGRPSPYVDENGNLRPNVPEDVKEHNKSMEDRYDRPYNQIGDEGTVQAGYSSKWKKS
ncbi:Conserved serine-rich protein [Aspergillus sp. HF37]|nr:Conserved serine-rich protein [Aspergillus sp. HF37]